MKIAANYFSFIAFGVMIAFGVGYIGSFGVRFGPPSQRTNVSMTVGDINGLAVGANVLLRGVPVGKVSHIAASVGGATIDFYIDNRFRIPTDSDVRLDNLSALGETYIGLFPRREGGPILRDGQHIATESVEQPPSITELAVSVTRVLDQLDPNRVERILTEVDTGLGSPSLVLPNISHVSKLLRITATNLHGQGRVLLSNFQTLLRNSGWLGPNLAAIGYSAETTAPSLRGMMECFAEAAWNVRPEGFVRTRALLQRIEKLLDTNAGDIKVLGEALQSRVKGIAGALLNFDPSQILANIVNTLPEDGAITLHVAIPQN